MPFCLCHVRLSQEFTLFMLKCISTSFYLPPSYRVCWSQTAPYHVSMLFGAFPLDYLISIGDLCQVFPPVWVSLVRPCLLPTLSFLSSSPPLNTSSFTHSLHTGASPSFPEKPVIGFYVAATHMCSHASRWEKALSRCHLDNGS